MLKHIVITITAAAISLFTMGTASAMISEPDVVYYGTAASASAGSIVSIRLNGASAPVTSFSVGADLSYQLRVPMDAVGARLPDTARTGDTAVIYIDGVTAASVIIPARGSVVRLDPAKRDQDEWAKLHPGDDGSGDLNGNGRTDLEDFLAGLDPAVVPIVTLSTLADNSTTKYPVLNVGGTAGIDAGLKSLTVNGTTATMTADGGFSAAVVLAEGPNVITVTAVDNLDRKSIKTRTITLDRTAPGLTITAPADNGVTDQVVSTITGSVDATSTVTVTLNDDTPLVATMDQNTFSGTVNLASGMNTLHITATDLAGNSSSAKRTMTYDTIVPRLAITQPAQDGLVTAPTVTVTGTVSDSLVTGSVLITTGTGTYIPAVTSGSFSQAITLPSEGTHSITVTATDAAGKTSTVVRNVIRVVLGDLDENGSVDVLDALKVLRIAAGFATPTALEAERADVAPLVDGIPRPDGKIDIGDVVVILRRAMGLTDW